MAVPLIVATPSDNKNQPNKKMRTCRRCSATLIVPHSDFQANATYRMPVINEASRTEPVWLGNGGPGRRLSHNAVGIVNVAHQRPTTNRTVRMGMVDVDPGPEGWLLEYSRIMQMLISCTKTAAA